LLRYRCGDRFGTRFLIEVSGNINAENVLEYAKLDIDIISCGYITHSSKALDMSLEVVEVAKP